MEKLYYDRENKKFYVKELKTEKSGDILLVVDEQYVDVTDEIKDMVTEPQDKTLVFLQPVELWQIEIEAKCSCLSLQHIA